MHVEDYAFNVSSGAMRKLEKACPLVLRYANEQTEVLAFTHPSAGKQFVKGTIEPEESPIEAANRELREESGLITTTPLISLGVHPIGELRQPWHFFKHFSSGLPETWTHQTEDDFGHTFRFIWHPLNQSLDQRWHAIFHEAFAFFSPLCLAD